MNKVAGVDLDAELVLISLIKRLENTLGIIIRRPPILHKLYGIVVEVSRATLRTVVENRHLQICSIKITNSNSRINWIIVVRYIEVLFIIDTRLASHEIPGVAVVKDALLHTKSIGVSPKASIVVETVQEAPVNQYILTAHVFV